MRKWTCVFLALFLVGSLSSMALAQQKQIKLKAVQFVNMGNPSEKPFHYFVDSVNKQAKGELSIEIVGGPDSIAGTDQPEAVRSGAVDLAFVPCGWYQSVLPVASVMGLSRVTPMEGRKTRLHDFLVEEHKKVGLRFIGANDFSGPFYMYAKKPIAHPDELKGLRFRHSPTYTFFKGIGLTPITAAHSDVYTGLERNLFDGLATKPGTFVELCLYEVCKFVIGPGFWPDYSTVTIMNEAKFGQLPKHLQGLMMGAMEKGEPAMKALCAPDIEQQWKTMKEKGMKHIEWSPEVSKKFLDHIDALTWEIRVKKLPEGMAEKLKKMMGY